MASISNSTLQHQYLLFSTTTTTTMATATKTTLSGRRARTQISARRSGKRRSTSDSDLGSDLASRAEEIRTQAAEREEAVGRSRELLFAELCRHLAAGEDRVAADWGRMAEEERWVLVRGFVDGWSDHFHPLSATSVKEMVEAHLVRLRAGTKKGTTPFCGTAFSAGLRKFLGF